MRRQRSSARPLVRWALFLPLLILAIGLLAGGAPREASASLDPEEQALFMLIKEYRAQNGLATLALNAQLNDAARWMSEDMAANDYFSHTDSLGRDPFQRMADFGYTYNTVMGENLAGGAEAAQAVFDLWKSSPGHKANMLNQNFKVIGIARGYGSGTAYRWYWVADFGGQGAPFPPPSPTPAPTSNPTPPATPSSSRLGDVDCDGDVDAVDALAILRHLAGLPRQSVPPGCPPIASLVLSA